VDPADERFWKFVRDQFPLTHERAYLNTGGLGASPYVVIDEVKSRMDELEKVSETGHTEELWKSIKADTAAILGCDPLEVAFVRNTTEGINIVAHGLSWERGDEVILTTHEHVGNALTWLGLKDREGIVLKLFEPSVGSAQENLDRIGRLITRRTRLISIPHVVTTTGLILPVAEIGSLARAQGILYLVDGAQTAGMMPLDLHAMGCDAYATSGHKWLLGPKETGLLYVRRESLDRIQAKHIGAYSSNEFDFLKGSLTLFPGAQRYEYGTVNIPLRCGLWAGIRFLQRIGMSTVWQRDRALAGKFFEEARRIPGVRLLSPENPDLRSALITFVHERKSNMEVQEHLTALKLRTRAVGEGGLAALRVSFHLYNTFEEAEKVLEGLRTIH
jgi:selenocysteine lyase/cysteine desulfurase